MKTSQSCAARQKKSLFALKKGAQEVFL